MIVVSMQDGDESPTLEWANYRVPDADIRVQVWRSVIDGVPVVQIDTGAGLGVFRVSLNDGPPIWEGDPEK